jgi:hypothetical protein
MNGIDTVHGDDVGDGGLRIVQASAEEQAAIRAMLSKRAESAPAGAGVGRVSALAWAGLRLAAIVLLAAGVGIGLGDGDEFDDVGCSVAQQPGGTSHGARSAQARERAGGTLPGCDGGSAGASGDSGPGGRPECEVRAAMCAHRMADGPVPEVEPAVPVVCPRGGSEGVGGRGKAEVGKAETFPINLLKQVLGSTTEELAAIKCILGGPRFPDWQKGAPTTQQGVSAQRPGPAGGLKVARGKQVSQVAPLASPPSEQTR